MSTDCPLIVQARATAGLAKQGLAPAGLAKQAGLAGLAYLDGLAALTGQAGLACQSRTRQAGWVGYALAELAGPHLKTSTPVARRE